jgi:UMF1 family MFS transporter
MKLDRAKLGWALYDWGNSAFATIVIAGFFPVLFKDYWSAGLQPAESTLRLGMANSLASLVIVLLAPVLGAIADSMSRRKAMLAGFAFLGVVMTAALYLVGQGGWLLAVLLYVLALLGFSGSNIFYDALLPFVADADDVDQVSALGFSLGYLGGGLMLAANVWFSQHPDLLGQGDALAVIRISFLLVAVWWLVFTVPLLLLVSEGVSSAAVTPINAVSAGFSRIWHTLHEIRSLRHVWLFLLAYWLYIDGVDTIIRMAVDYGLSLGFSQTGLVTALLITQFTGFPAALVFGWIGSRTGPRAGILAGIGIYLLITVWASRMNAEWEFYTLAFAIGLVQGGIQALSRSYYARMIPVGRSAEFFGFYNMLGKFAAVLGPLMVGLVGVISGNPRAGILSLSVLFVSGAVLLMAVNPPRVAQARPE